MIVLWERRGRVGHWYIDGQDGNQHILSDVQSWDGLLRYERFWERLMRIMRFVITAIQRRKRDTCFYRSIR